MSQNYDSGLCCSYDEVLRYRVSAAKYTGEQDYTARGLSRRGWCDNYDLNVFTPNGKWESHTMAVEFTQNPRFTKDQDEIEGEEVIIPRLSKSDMKDVKLSELCPIQFEYY